MSVIVQTGPGALDRSMRIYTPSVGVTHLPWIPTEIAVSNLAAAWEEGNRPGRTPVLRRTGLNLPKTRLAFTVTNGGGSIAQTLAELAAHAAAADSSSLLFAAANRGVQHITELSATETDWDQYGNPVKATVDMTLTAASDASVPIGPVKKKRR